MNFFTNTIDFEIDRIRPEFVLKHLLRLAFAKAAVENAPILCNYIFSICSGFINDLKAETVDFNTINFKALETYLDGLDNFQRFLFEMRMSTPILIIFIVAMLVQGLVYARSFEIAVLTIISPIPLATIAGDTHYHIAKGFLKEYSASVLKGACIIMSFGLYKATLTKLIETNISNMATIWKLTVATVVLLIMVFKSGNFVKAFFGGH